MSANIAKYVDDDKVAMGIGIGAGGATGNYVATKANEYARKAARSELRNQGPKPVGALLDRFAGPKVDAAIKRKLTKMKVGGAVLGAGLAGVGVASAKLVSRKEREPVSKWAEMLYGEEFAKAYQLDKTAARGYGGAHQTARKKYLKRMEAGEKFSCPSCGAEVSDKWQLGHNGDRSGYDGPQCTNCNAKDGGSRGGKAGTGEAKARWKDGKPHNRIEKAGDPADVHVDRLIDNAKKPFRNIKALPGVPAPALKLARAEHKKMTNPDNFSSIVKMDDEKRQVFGWAQIAEVNGEPVVDRQGDIVTIDEIAKAAHDFMTNSRTGGLMHRRGDDGKPVQIGHAIESLIVDEPIKKALSLPDETPVGWFLGLQVTDDQTWQDYKDGKYASLSVHGRGRRKRLD